MENKVANTLPKKERLCGKKGIESLLAKGKHGNAGAIRYIYTLDNGEEYSRILSGMTNIATMPKIAPKVPQMIGMYLLLAALALIAVPMI